MRDRGVGSGRGISERDGARSLARSELDAASSRVTTRSVSCCLLVGQETSSSGSGADVHSSSISVGVDSAHDGHAVLIGTDRSRGLSRLGGAVGAVTGHGHRKRSSRACHAVFVLLLYRRVSHIVKVDAIELRGRISFVDHVRRRGSRGFGYSSCELSRRELELRIRRAYLREARIVGARRETSHGVASNFVEKIEQHFRAVGSVRLSSSIHGSGLDEFAYIEGDARDEVASVAQGLRVGQVRHVREDFLCNEREGFAKLFQSLRFIDLQVCVGCFRELFDQGGVQLDNVKHIGLHGGWEGL